MIADNIKTLVKRHGGLYVRVSEQGFFSVERALHGGGPDGRVEREARAAVASAIFMLLRTTRGT